jgi:hypothetical protein
VVPKLDFTSEKERNEFLTFYANTLPERLRQTVLTWRNNKRQKEADAAKKEEEAQKAKPEPSSLPETQRRERERAAARRALP